MSLKFCIICKASFDARGRAKTCSKGCSKERAKRWREKRHQERLVDPEYVAMRKKLHADWQKEKIENDVAWRDKRNRQMRERMQERRLEDGFRERENLKRGEFYRKHKK